MANISCVFAEPDEYEAALSDCAGVDLLVTGRGQFEARLTSVALGGVGLVAGRERLSRVAVITSPASAVSIYLPVAHGRSPVWGGASMPPGEILILGPGEQVHSRTDGWCAWSFVWLRKTVLTRYARALTGASFRLRRGVNRWHPARDVLRSVVRLHAAAIRRADAHPGAPLPAAAAHGLEQELIEGVVECLTSGEPDEATAASQHQAGVMVSFESLCRANTDRSLHVSDICVTLGVSERTLRSLCREHLGMSPHTYLQLRRLHVAHHALRCAQSPGTSVAEIARAHGFRELGRFAAMYRARFGELPSVTLRNNSAR